MYEDEIWADVPHYVGVYQVSNYGRVVRCKQLLPSLEEAGKRVHLNFLTPVSRYAGRLSVSLCFMNIPKWRQIHRLVLEAFVGPCPPGMECRHLDGNHLNNHLGNLEWNTHEVNMHDKVRHGTQQNTRGENHKRAKLCDDDIREIRAATATNRALAEIYGVSNVAIHFIRTRKTWKHVS